MAFEDVERRYQDLVRYVGWNEDDAQRLRQAAPVLRPHWSQVVEDFFQEAQRHDATRQVLSGEAAQLGRLKQTLARWLEELVTGPYDAAYVIRRWRVGWRHVDIGLSPMYISAAFSRLRGSLGRLLAGHWTASAGELEPVRAALHRRLDLDLALMEDAYQAELLARQQQGERLAALGQLSAGVAHELRGPLNVIRTSAYFLEQAGRLSPEKAGEHLLRISRQVDLAERAIEALARLARTPRPELRPWPVAELLRQALESDPPGPGIAVELECPDGLPAALADPEQVRIVLGNLIRNARDAMPEGGRLRLAARVVAAGLEIDVSDTGPGIGPDELGQILEPLYSTKPDGLGMGLAIARSILDKMGGGLSVVSSPGQGATFTVRLRAAAGP